MDQPGPLRPIHRGRSREGEDGARGWLTGAPPGFTVDAVQQDALYPDDTCVQKLVTDPTTLLTTTK